jgi:hypothetical protein
VCQWQATLFDLGAPGPTTALNAGRWAGDPRRASCHRHVAGPTPRPPWGRHVAVPDPFPGEGGSGPPRPLGAVRPVMVWPSHVAAPDLHGESGSAGATRGPPAFLGTWRPRTSKSTGEVRRPWSQLSGPDRTPRHPKDEGKITDGETLRAWTP